MPGTFIDVQVEAGAAADPELARRLVDVCPVDIFAADDHGVQIVQSNLDECVLCELCIEAAPADAIKVLKLYSGESLPDA